MNMAIKYYYDLLNRDLKKYRDKKIALYGVGGHTRMLLDILEYTDNILGLIDNDESNFGKFVYGYKVFSIEQIKEDIDAIVISSDVYQDLIYERIKHLKDYGIDVIKIYEIDKNVIGSWVDIQKNNNHTSKNTILIRPECDYQLNDNIFYEKNDTLHEINQGFYATFRKQLHNVGYELMTIDKGNLKSARYIIFHNIPKTNDMFFNYCVKEKLNNLVVFLWEPEVVIPNNYDKNIHRYFKYIFTWNDDLVDNKKYFKIRYTKANEILLKTNSEYYKRKLCTLISSGSKESCIDGELYSERKVAIKYFQEHAPNEFELYGMGWSKEYNKCYIGETKNKQETLSNFRFCICYENQINIKGYITEKILDCLLSGCIPIYLGAENINEYIDENLFIDKRKFNTYGELYDYIKNIDENKFNMYLSNIYKFVNDDKFKYFRDETIIQEIISRLTN